VRIIGESGTHVSIGRNSGPGTAKTACPASDPFLLNPVPFTMRKQPSTFELSRVQVYPLSERHSLSQADDILIDPDSPPPSCSPQLSRQIAVCAAQIRAARQRDATVSLIYGAHLLRNGAALLIDRLLAQGWLTHLATNGAGSIHDWEFAYHGRSTENVRDNVAQGRFGTWDETGRYIQLALLAGGLEGLGYGAAVGQMITNDGFRLPTVDALKTQLQAEPHAEYAAARADLLHAMLKHNLASGQHTVQHSWKHASILESAQRNAVPLTVHPGIGYDIISNHPLFNGAAIGRAAERDFCEFATAVEGLDHGVVLSVGSAIMGPQVFEKTLSCVNNVRLQEGRGVISGHSIFVVDLQQGDDWDWSTGEPPKTSAAYYLRFCKSYSRMGGTMHYLRGDNTVFLHHLYHELQSPAET